MAREQMARLEDSLKSLHERQRKLLQETERLENLRATAGRFTRAQSSTINDLARQQKSLEGETSQLADKLALAEVINLALAGAAKHMTCAAELLEHRQTGAATQGAQEAARSRFNQLLSAFENKSNTKKQPDGESGSGGGGGSGENANQLLTQLKLLKILQEDLNVRYRAAGGAAPDTAGGLSEQLPEMAAEQGKLAELALKLAAPSDKNPEDDPEELPDVRNERIEPADVPAPDGPLEAPRKDPS